MACSAVSSKGTSFISGPADPQRQGIQMLRCTLIPGHVQAAKGLQPKEGISDRLSRCKPRQGEKILCQGAPFGCLAPAQLVGYLTSGIISNSSNEARSDPLLIQAHTVFSEKY